jgi:hypothetical protein
LKNNFRPTCDRRLHIVIAEPNVCSVRLLAKLVCAADAIVPFTREFSFEFKTAAEASFKKENVIHEIIKLLRTLTDFCADAFGFGREGAADRAREGAQHID